MGRILYSITFSAKPLEVGLAGRLGCAICSGLIIGRSIPATSVNPSQGMLFAVVAGD